MPGHPSDGQQLCSRAPTSHRVALRTLRTCTPSPARVATVSGAGAELACGTLILNRATYFLETSSPNGCLYMLPMGLQDVRASAFPAYIRFRAYTTSGRTQPANNDAYHSSAEGRLADFPRDIPARMTARRYPSSPLRLLGWSSSGR
uniref:Uncharacterized protein n=1 Tax=Mycena chlorophos TaxID=658473 RepID=A0ABQ0L6X2_MYCCL|nr:predicted protein [Mycena chlorophos]